MLFFIVSEKLRLDRDPFDGPAFADDPVFVVNGVSVPQLRPQVLRQDRELLGMEDGGHFVAHRGELFPGIALKIQTGRRLR